VRFDEWRWKVSYGLPPHGKDYWTKKMEDKEAEASVVRKMEHKRPSMKRFSWRKCKNKSVVAIK